MTSVNEGLQMLLFLRHDSVYKTCKTNIDIHDLVFEHFNFTQMYKFYKNGEFFIDMNLNFKGLTLVSFSVQLI